MKTFHLYKSDKESSYTFLEAENSSNTTLIPEDAKLIWEVKAKSWEIACMKKHEYLDWEPYKPMIDSKEDLLEFLPVDKFDVDNFQLLQNLGYPRIEPILMEIFEWVQDFNWPIAKKIVPFLVELGAKTKPQIQEILLSSDGMWKYWVISEIISKMKIEEIKKFKSVLTHLVTNLTNDDREYEVDIVALEVLEKLRGIK